MPEMKWYHAALLGSGAAAGIGMLFYYLTRDEASDKEECKTADTSTSSLTSLGKKISVDTITKEQVLEIILEIRKSQAHMKGILRNLTTMLVKEPHTFPQLHAKVLEIDAEDPLEKNNMSMMEFDRCLEKFAGDPHIQESVCSIMVPSTTMRADSKAAKTTSEEVIQIHEYMVEKMAEIVDDISKLPDKESFSSKAATIAAQAMVSAETEKKFGLDFEEVESAVMLNQERLGTSAAFAEVNCRMQATLSELLNMFKDSQSVI